MVSHVFMDIPENNHILDRLFPDGIIAAVATPRMWHAELPPEEQAIVVNAVEKRRRQFTAGRTCARVLLGQFGFAEGLIIVKDAHGAPIWPDGIAGSISHTDDLCLVAMARKSSQLASIGIDVEQDCGLEPDLVRLVCDELEWRSCCHNHAEKAYRLAKVIFSAKESVYKCLYPLTRKVLDFSDVHIRLDSTGQRFTVTADGNVRDGLLADELSGRVFYEGSHVYTGCVLPGE
jgi:4'-phosphopantetheinyl transferase EntD